jgi:hypothetical protein
MTAGDRWMTTVPARISLKIVNQEGRPKTGKSHNINGATNRTPVSTRMGTIRAFQLAS